MKGIVLVAMLGLTGCVGVFDRAGDALCRNRDMVEKAANLALIEAQSILDPVRREAAIAAIRVTLAALEKCPGDSRA